MEAETTLRVAIRGRVQGVGFRYSLQHIAEQNDVSGWCRNTPDGGVEALFHGPRANVERVIAWCRQGPGTARVDDLRVTPAPGEEPRPGFRIRA